MPLFVPLGQLVITPAALKALAIADVLRAIERHELGDWGEVCPEDRAANEESLRNGSRLLSVYWDRNETAIWVITEADRSATTVLLPSDY